MHRMRGLCIVLALITAAPSIAVARKRLVTGAAQRGPAPGAAQADDPAIMGVWEGVMDWPDKSVHAVLLHNGRVLWYRGEGANGSYSYTWDPITHEIRQQFIGFGIFCSGNSVMSDGRVLTTGGRIGTTGTLGPRYSVIYDPNTEQWSEGPAMRKGRYYPTNTELGDGRTLVFSGYDSTHTFNDQVESFIPGTGPNGSDEWELLPADHYIAYYPRMHLLTNGKVFHTGKDPVSETLDPATGVWTTVATSNFGQRREGSSVMLPPGFNKFMIMGGDTGTKTTEIIDLSAPTPTWTYAAPMNYGRAFLNSVILPDGTVLVSGGSQDGLYVLPAEIYNPAANTWQVVAAMHRDRLYHSSGLLLPDGRALWCGADSNHTGEVYDPPYLFKGARPVISSAPTGVQYGDLFHVQTPDAANIGSVVFMRPGASTHSFDMAQRYVPLTFTAVAGGLDIQVPTNPNIAPPGYYMLFILDRNKIPSVSKFVHVGPTPGPPVNRPPTVSAGPDQNITPPASAVLSGSVADDNLPNPPGVCTRRWRKVLGPGTVSFADSTSAQTTATFSINGTYKLSLTAFDGALSASDTTAILVGTTGACSSAVDQQVTTGADDAEESGAGAGNAVDLVSADLDLGQLTVGMRFTGIDIPQGATITGAYVQFTVGQAQPDTTTLKIYGQAADSADVLVGTAKNLSLRPKTSAFVAWAPPAWNQVGLAGPDQRTPNLASVIQEIVNRPGWLRKSIALVITGSGHRTAWSYQGAPAGAARLHIDVSCAAVNRAPTVNAGPDQVITLPASASLVDTVTDDGLPAPPGEVFETWRKLIGPGDVTFEQTVAPFRAARPMHDINITASFSLPGTYVLRLTAYDGALSTTDDMQVVVLPPPTMILDRTVATGSDDAEESGATSGNTVDLASIDLDLGQLTVGMRFTGVDIPQSAIITKAYVQFTAAKTQPDLTPLKIFGQASDSAEVFVATAKNVSLRPKTGTSVAWAPPAWNIVGDAGPDQRTPDLRAVVQEIVNRPGWRRKSIGLLITGSGHRTAVSYQGAPATAARMHIEYASDPNGDAEVVPRSPGTASAQAVPAPGATRLVAVFPNPGSGPASVRFDLARQDEVQLELYDIRGALVRNIASGLWSAGAHTEIWDGRDRNGNSVPSGVYLLRFAAGSYRETRRLVVLRDGRTSSVTR